MRIEVRVKDKTGFGDGDEIGDFNTTQFAEWAMEMLEEYYYFKVTGRRKRG